MGMFAGIWILLAALHVQGKTPPPNLANLYSFLLHRTSSSSRAIMHTLELFIIIIIIIVRGFRAKWVKHFAHFN